MTQDFETITEFPMHVEDEGEGTSLFDLEGNKNSENGRRATQCGMGSKGDPIPWLSWKTSRARQGRYE